MSKLAQHGIKYKFNKEDDLNLVYRQNNYANSHINLICKPNFNYLMIICRFKYNIA